MKIYRLSVSPPYFNLPVCVDGDVSSFGKLGNRIKFQSTPSVGMTTANYLFDHWTPEQFQSTPSVGRATAKTYKYATLCLYIVHIKLYIFATAVFLIDLNSRKSTSFSVRTYGIFYDRCRFALKHKESFRLISGLGSDMLYFCLIVVPEIIKSQTVLFGVDELFELVFY